MSGAPSVDAYLDGSTPAADDAAITAAVREYCSAVETHLREIHAASDSGRDLIVTRSDLIDRLVRRLFGLAEERHLAGGGEVDTELTVLAVGGYGRREMNVHSDVDILFLYRKLRPFVSAIVDRVQIWLWDASLEVGSASRTISETVGLARKDVTVRTGLLSHRFLVGSGVLFHALNRRFREQLFSDPERFIREQMEAVQERHTQFGDSLYLLQPNVKESAGGLRDYHASYWAMQAAQPNARGRDDFLHLGLLTEEELREYQSALAFLWKVRNELHFVTGRKTDQMSFGLQERIAASLGYEDRDEQLPVEQFMGDYYRRARAIRNYSSLVMEQCHARVRRAPFRRRVKDVEHGFRIVAGQLEIPHSRQLRKDPLNLFHAFAVAQKHDVRLTRKARRMIRENLDLIDEGFRSSAEASELFQKILSANQRVVRTLMTMNEDGLLAAYLPEWDHIVCRWQHVMYHTYTVDVHTIFVVEQLRRLWRGDSEAERPRLTQLVREVDDLPVLFFGSLFHDIGKGMGGDHSEKGTQMARECLKRLGLEAERIERVAFLVNNHLSMSRLAQTRDLTDPKLILDFAHRVGDRQNLRDLYLLTYADMRASSPDAWTDWKGRLLRELFERTSELLEAGADDPKVASDLVNRRVGRAAALVGQALRMNPRHVVVFARQPRFGTVKTRLAADIGPGAALAFYRRTLTRLLTRLGQGRPMDDVAGRHAAGCRPASPAVAGRAAAVGPGAWQSGGSYGCGVPRRAAGTGRHRRAATFQTCAPAHVAAAFRLLDDHDAVFRADARWRVLPDRPAPGTA